MLSLIECAHYCSKYNNTPKNGIEISIIQTSSMYFIFNILNADHQFIWYHRLRKPRPPVFPEFLVMLSHFIQKKLHVLSSSRLQWKFNTLYMWQNKWMIRTYVLRSNFLSPFWIYRSNSSTSCIGSFVEFYAYFHTHFDDTKWIHGKTDIL